MALLKFWDMSYTLPDKSRKRLDKSLTDLSSLPEISVVVVIILLDTSVITTFVRLMELDKSAYPT